MGRKVKQKIILNNIEVLRADAKSVSVGKTEEGKTVLIKGAIPGDVVDVHVLKKKSSYLEGQAVAFHKKSEYRGEY